MWTKDFWIDTIERAVKTFAQAAVAGIGANAMGVLDVDWLVVVSVAGLAAAVSVLTSIASAPLSTKGTASLVSEVGYKEAA